MPISVVIPVYNAAPYLAECIASILSQLPDDAEVVCVDDGSTDSSLMILTEFAQEDSRVCVIRQDNQGQGAARNRGLAVARGAFVYFADADDALTGDFTFEQLVNEMTRHDLDLLFFDAETKIDETAKLPESAVLARYYVRRHDYSSVYSGADLFARFVANHEFVVSPPLMLLRRSFLLENSLRFPEGCYYEDNVFVQHVMLAARRASHRPWRFYLRKVHAGSTITRKPTLRHLLGRMMCYQDTLIILHQQVWSSRVRTSLRERLRVYKHYLRRLVREDPELVAQCEGLLSSAERSLIHSVKSYPLRDKIADTLQCLKDRGLVYTVKRISLNRV